MKLKIRSNKLKDYLVIVLFGILAYFYIAMLLHSGKLFVGTDRIFHLERMEEFYRTFKSGHLVSMVSTFSFSKIGQPINTYYPWGNLIFYALIRSCFNNPITAYYLFIGLEQFLGLLVAYYSVLKINGRRRQALGFSIILRFSSYILFNDFSMAANGQAWAMVFMPLVFSGFYCLVIKNEYLTGSIAMVLGLTAEVYCHVLTCAITIIALVIVYGISLFFQKNKVKTLISIVSSVVVFLVTSSGFMVPMIISMSQNNVLFPKIGKQDFSAMYPLVKRLSQVILLSLDNSVLWRSPNIGLVLITAAFLGALSFNKNNFLDKISYLLGVMFLVLGSTMLPWMVIKGSPLNIFQFPWRFFSLSILFLAYFVSSKIYSKKVVLFFVTALTVYMGFTGIRMYELSQSAHKVAITPTEQTHPWNYFITSKNYEHILSLNRNVASDSHYSDYLPKNSVENRNEVLNHRIQIGNQRVYLDTKSIKPSYQGETYLVPEHQQREGTITLPFYIYNIADYSIYINGKKERFNVNKGSLPTFSFNTKQEIKVKIQYKTPKVYIFIRYGSLSIIVLLSVVYCVVECKNKGRED